VRYAETDCMGVAHHSNYAVWFEAARTELLRELGVRYRDLEDRGYLLAVGLVETRLVAPARYDDLLSVECHVEEARSRKIVFAYEIRRPEDDRLIARGRTALVCVDREMRTRVLPDDVRAKLGPLRPKA
jgi:acyl-CoA thioester hydrolase